MNNWFVESVTLEPTWAWWVALVFQVAMVAWLMAPDPHPKT